MDPLTPVTTGDPHVSAHNAEREAINLLAEDVETKMDLPTTPLVGQLIRWNGTSWQPSVTRLFEGEGDPNGKVAAPVGSRYVDLKPGQPAVEWTKSTGTATSNTGWTRPGVLRTDFLNISALVDTRGTAVVYTAVLARWGEVVDLYLDLKMPTNTTSPWLVLTLPVGFRPPVLRHGGIQDNNEAASVSTSVGSDGKVQLYTLTSGKRDRYTGTWLTREAWPATPYPGTPLA